MIVISPDRYPSRSSSHMIYRRRSPADLCRSRSDPDPSMCSKRRVVL